MVTSPDEWKILEWDEKPQTNKQTKISQREKYGSQMVPGKKNILSGSQNLIIWHRPLNLI